jgi:predicted amidohydrolase YtcJ
VGGAKIFSDGVPMNHTSWFHEPYGPENDRGALVIVGDSEQARLNELHELVRMLNAHDLQAGIHAIGDAAADAAAEAIAAAQDTTGHRDLRHYLIHASVVRDSTVTLMREHGIGWTANPVISRLGRDAGGLEPGDSSSKERLRTILSRGGRPCLVTDSPIVSPDWRPNVVHAVTRSQFYRDRTDADDEGITGLDALALLTLMPAWQQHAEDERGTLAPGSLADLVVLGGTWPDDERIEELLDLPADQTYVGGVLVHERVRDVVG